MKSRKLFSSCRNWPVYHTGRLTTYLSGPYYLCWLKLHWLCCFLRHLAPMFCLQGHLNLDIYNLQLNPTFAKYHLGLSSVAWNWRISKVLWGVSSDFQKAPALLCPINQPHAITLAALRSPVAPHISGLSYGTRHLSSGSWLKPLLCIDIAYINDALISARGCVWKEKYPARLHSLTCSLILIES